MAVSGWTVIVAWMVDTHDEAAEASAVGEYAVGSIRGSKWVQTATVVRDIDPQTITDKVKHNRRDCSLV
jgi:hypothetical protein